MKTALLIVDVQNDFMPGGSLAVPDGDKIIEPLIKAAKEADLVVVSRDWHPKDHFSFQHHGGHWPVHCVKETKGARIPPKIRKLAHYVISKGTESDKDAYSMFAGHTLRPRRSLAEILQDQEIERVIVGGLAMDVCVMFTALDASASGYQTFVGLDLTRALSAVGESEAIERLTKAGVHVQNIAS